MLFSQKLFDMDQGGSWNTEGFALIDEQSPSNPLSIPTQTEENKTAKATPWIFQLPFDVYRVEFRTNFFSVFFVFFSKKPSTTCYVKNKLICFALIKVFNRPISIPDFIYIWFLRRIKSPLTCKQHEIYRAIIVPNWPHCQFWTP